MKRCQISEDPTLPLQPSNRRIAMKLEARQTPRWRLLEHMLRLPTAMDHRVKKPTICLRRAPGFKRVCRLRRCCHRTPKLPCQNFQLQNKTQDPRRSWPSARLLWQSSRTINDMKVLKPRLNHE